MEVDFETLFNPVVRSGQRGRPRGSGVRGDMFALLSMAKDIAVDEALSPSAAARSYVGPKDTNGVDRLTGKFHDKPGLLLAARTALKKKRVLELRRAVLACAEAQSGIFFTNVKSEFQAAQAFQAVHGIDDFTWSQPEVQTAFKKAWAATAVLRLLYQSPELGGGLRASLAGQFPVIFLRRGTPRAEYAHRLNVSGGSSPNQPW